MNFFIINVSSKVGEKKLDRKNNRLLPRTSNTKLKKNKTG